MNIRLRSGDWLPESQPISETGTKITQSPRNTHSLTYANRALLVRYPSGSGRENDQSVAATSAGGIVNIRFITDVKNSTLSAAPATKDTAHPTASPGINAVQCLCSLLAPIRCNRPRVATTEAIISLDATMISKNSATPAPVSPTTPPQDS